MVYYYLKKFNIKPTFGNYNRKYTFNDYFFETPNIDNSYWAGFIAADGCIHSNQKTISIGSLSAIDRDILVAFNKAINHNGPIRESFVTTSYSKVPRHYVHVSLYNACNSIHHLKLHWNITPRKTLSLLPPSSLSRENALAYIIGNFDGDGWITKCNKKHTLIGWSGTFELVNWIKNILLPISLSTAEPHKVPNGQCYILRYGADIALNIINELKKVPTKYRLSRKWHLDA